MTEIQKENPFTQFSNNLKIFISGGIAGCTARIFTAPMERLVILRQTNHPKYSNFPLAKMVEEIYYQEGFTSFWKGNGTNLIRVFPFSATELFSFEVYKYFIQKILNTLGQCQIKSKEAQYLTAGAFAGLTAATIVYPLDLLRTLYAYQTDSIKFSGIISSWKQIINQNGFFNLYRGLGASLMGIVPYSGIKLGVFQKLKDLTQSQYTLSKDLNNFINGAISGCIAISLTYPTDLLRKRAQIEIFSDTKTQVKYRQLIEKIYFQEGIKGFFKGLFTVYLKFIPLTAITLSVNEKMKSSLVNQQIISIFSKYFEIYIQYFILSI